MWTSFWRDGGFGMYPIALLGFCLIAASVLYALRPDPRSARIVGSLAFATFAAGVLGTCTGISTTLHFIADVPAGRQFDIMAEGIAESLHNVVLGLMLVGVGALLTVVGAVRSKLDPAREARSV
jgi:MotA/TolQ/ExbB proton channel family